MRLFEVQMEDTQICSGQTAELTVEKNKTDKEDAEDETAHIENNYKQKENERKQDSST